MFQTFFKSIGPRTYASQVKEASNGNHYLVLTEGKRDEETDELRKMRVFAADVGLGFVARWPNSSALLYQVHRTLMWAGRFREGTELAARYEALSAGRRPTGAGA